MAKNSAPRPRLGRATILAVAFRTFFLEASWNHDGQQNLGFAAAINPALKLFYKDRPEELAKARNRDLQFFNTNPVISGLVIGAALKLEEEVADGSLEAERGANLVNALAATLAIPGDLFFWQSWLPFCCLLGFGLTWLSVAAGRLTFSPLLIPILYCALAWPTRIGGIFLGYRQGRKAYEAIERFKIPFFARFFQKFSAGLIGFLAVWGTLRILGEPIEVLGETNNPRNFFPLAAAGAVLVPVLAQKLWPKLGPKALYLTIALALALVGVLFR
jgi:hypothetical protein